MHRIECNTITVKWIHSCVQDKYLFSYYTHRDVENIFPLVVQQYYKYFTLLYMPSVENVISCHLKNISRRYSKSIVWEGLYEMSNQYSEFFARCASVRQMYIHIFSY